MRDGGDCSGRTRREWLKQALLGGAAMPLLLRDAMAAVARPSGMVEVTGEVLINGRPARAGAAVTPGDSVATASGASAVFVIGRDAFLMRESSELRTAGRSVLAGSMRRETFMPVAGRRSG